jgi:hypothetical protein
MICFCSSDAETVVRAMLVDDEPPGRCPLGNSCMVMQLIIRSRPFLVHQLFFGRLCRFGDKTMQYRLKAGLARKAAGVTGHSLDICSRNLTLVI